MEKGQLVFVDRTVWLNDVLNDADSFEERKNEPVVFDHEEVLEVGGKDYHRYWFIAADGTVDFVQGCPPPKTAEEVFGKTLFSQMHI